MNVVAEETVSKTPMNRLLDMLAGWADYVGHEEDEYPDTLKGEQIAGLYQEAGALMERDFPDIESEQDAVCRFVTERVTATLLSIEPVK